MNWKPIRSVDYLVVHCSATRDDQDVSAEDIRGLHMRKGWVDIGYHKVIRRDGTIENGRPVTRPGAHARGFNHVSLGICMAGGCASPGKDPSIDIADWYENYAAKAPAEDNFTDEQYAVLSGVLKAWKTQYPDAEVLGHRDLPNVNKACPSFDVREWWASRN